MNGTNNWKLLFGKGYELCQYGILKPDMPKEKIWNMQLNEQIIILGDGDKQSFLKYNKKAKTMG